MTTEKGCSSVVADSDPCWAIVQWSFVESKLLRLNFEADGSRRDLHPGHILVSPNGLLNKDNVFQS